jgi:hypothetical protein
MPTQDQAVLDELGIKVEDTLQVKVQVLYRGNEVDAVDMSTLAVQPPEIQEIVLAAITEQFGKILANIEEKWPAALAAEQAEAVQPR